MSLIHFSRLFKLLSLHKYTLNHPNKILSTLAIRSSRARYYNFIMSESSKEVNYLSELYQKRPHSDMIEEALRVRKATVEQSLQEGQLNVAQSNKEVISKLLKNNQINPFESHYKGFFFQSDPEKSQERYEIFKRMKEEYSKEKTAVVVKAVEEKVKEWTAKKSQIKKRQQRSKQKKRRVEVEMLEQMKKMEVEQNERAKQQHLQQVKDRIRKMEEKRYERHEFMKQSSIRSLDVSRTQAPKYQQMEAKFKQIEEKIKQEREKVLKEKREGLTVKKQEILQHSKKYAQTLKKKEEERKEKQKVKRRGHSVQGRDAFDNFSTEHNKQVKREEEAKLKRRQEFNKKIKSMKLVINSHQQQEEQQSPKARSLSNSDKAPVSPKVESPELSRKSPPVMRKKVQSLHSDADGRKLGNDYLRALRDRDHSKLVGHQTASASLPSLKPTYRNYLTDLKIKRRPVKDEIEQLKRSCMTRHEIYNTLTQKSDQYEESMLKKISELRKIEKYEDSVKKENEIDEAFNRYINTKIACAKINQD